MKILLFLSGLVMSLFWLITSSCTRPQSLPTQAELASSDSLKKLYITTGRMISQASFTALSAELKAALSDGGVPKAISYCKLQAIPLTDSLSKVYDVDISRVAMKYRNPGNKANPYEENMLNEFMSSLINTRSVQPTVKAHSDAVYYYDPILTKPLCLNCHGTPGTEISDENMKIIQQYYPEDKAVGFGIADLRGMWVVRFNKAL